MQKVVFKILSDHIPIALTSGQLDFGPRSFRFVNVWGEDIDLLNLVTNVWHE